MTALFSLGEVVSTPGAIRVLDVFTMGNLLQRHGTGDWGTLCDEDRALNQASLDPENPGRIFSAYNVKGTDGEYHRIWVITEWDRSVTTFLLPEEY